DRDQTREVFEKLYRDVEIILRQQNKLLINVSSGLYQKTIVQPQEFKNAVNRDFDTVRSWRFWTKGKGLEIKALIVHNAPG
ncbi:hypothetical protein, partial [Escherichia coli]|uniref:hypothetical protein n=1 Tax=Escherichia coli TaxID=562 RepID=UPI0028DFB781